MRNLNLTFGVVDHVPSTLPGRTGGSHPSRDRTHPRAARQLSSVRVHLFDVDIPSQGIVHVIATEHGIVLPGMTVVCGDSHTATSGGVGAWGWGIGTTEVERVFATQTLLIAETEDHARYVSEGVLAESVAAKDLILYLIGRLGVAVGTGYAVEYAGPAIHALPVERPADRSATCRSNSARAPG